MNENIKVNEILVTLTEWCMRFINVKSVFCGFGYSRVNQIIHSTITIDADCDYEIIKNMKIIEKVKIA